MEVPQIAARNDGKIRTAILVSILSVLLLSPALRTGYYGEDQAHSNIRGLMRLERCGLLENLKGYTGEVLAFGRFFPVTPLLVRAVHYFTQDAFLYKAVLLAWTVVELVLFYLLLRRWTNAGFAGMAMLLVAGLHQFRLSPDALLGYYLHMQVLAIGLFGSLLALDLWLERGGRHWQICSAFFFALALLTYEISATFLALYAVVIAWHRPSWRARFYAAIPFCLVVGAWLGITLYVRSHRLQSLDTYVHHPSFDPVAYLTAILNQISAAAPLSYFLFDPHLQFTDLPKGLKLLSWTMRQPGFWLALGMAVPVFWLLSKAVRGATGARPRFWVLTLSVGLLLIVLPTIMVAASPFHRDQFHPGSGWVCVMIQEHGAALVLTTAAWQFLTFGWWEQRLVAKRFGAAGLITAAIVVTHVWNVNFVPKFNRHSMCEGNNRANVEGALTHGLLQDVPENSTVLLTNAYAGWFDNFELYPEVSTAKMFFTARLPQRLKPVSAPLAAPELTRGPHYRLTDVCLGDRYGYVLLARSRGASDPDRVEEVRVYIHSKELFRKGSNTAAFALAEIFQTDDGMTTGHVLRLADQFRLLSTGPDWGIFTIGAIDCLAGDGGLRIVVGDRDLAALGALKPRLETAANRSP